MAGFCVSGFKIQQANPPAPPPPATPASIIVGPFNSGNSFSGGGSSADIPVSWGGLGPLEVGDLLLAFIVTFHDLSGVDIINFAGGLPVGWTMYRNDPNLGAGSQHGPIYYGIATHIVGAGDTGTPSYTFNVYNAGATHNAGIVSMVACRGSSGIAGSAVTALGNAAAGKITAPTVTTPAGNELVLVAAAFGTGSGSVISSDNGLSAAVPGNPQADAVFYQFSSGAMSSSQPLTCTNVNDAMSAYQVSILGT